MSSGSGNASGELTLAVIIDGFESSGYRGQLASRQDGRLLCLSCRQESDAGEMGLEAMRRTEGASDPADMLAVAALRCPRCGSRGTAVLGYGPAATTEDAEVLRRLCDRRPRQSGEAPASERPSRER